jgi:predicted Zn-dependent protease with MMP-like domain
MAAYDFQALALGPTSIGYPHRAMPMSLTQLTQLAATIVEATQKALPQALRPLAATVPVHFEALPDAELLAAGFEPDILGLFTGSPHGSDLSEEQPMPAEIVLFLENLWDFADGDHKVFCDEVRITYLHELGHFLGWDEDDLAARELD